METIKFNSNGWYLKQFINKFENGDMEAFCEVVNISPQEVRFLIESNESVKEDILRKLILGYDLSIDAVEELHRKLENPKTHPTCCVCGSNIKISIGEQKI